MKHQLHAVLAMIAVVTAASPATAEIQRFTKDCERALALSGGPAYMREEAGVYLLGKAGFELDRAGTNGYVCMVTREGDGIAPQCFDRAGQVSHVPVHIDETRKRIAGVSQEQIQQDRAAGFASGQYRPAPAPGVVYMASDYNFINTPNGDRLRVGAHVMYHAPYLTDEDIATDPAAFANPGMPFLNEEGPLGFMIGFIDSATDSTDVESACVGQLPDPANWRPIPVRK